VNLVEDVLERFPASKPALVTIDASGERQVWAFGELIARSAGLSGALAARGVGRGDVVMTLLGSRIEWVLTMLACWRMGAIALPCNVQLRRHDLEIRVAQASPALCVGAEELLGELPDGVPGMTLADVAAVMDEERPQEAPVEPADMSADESALIVFTSGTTGEPRGALHPYRYLAAQKAQAEHWLGARDGELVWVTTATGWSKSARNVFLAPWLQGAAALLHDGRFDPAERLAIAEREQVNVLCQAPTEYRLLAHGGKLRPLPSLRRAVSAGEALNAEVIEEFRERVGLDICDGYGQTETGHLAGTLVGMEARPGSMGRALPGLELRVRGERGEAGELEVRTETCRTFFSRYLDGERFTAEWWGTGDLVQADTDGYLWYQGRADDLIVSSGYRIGPFEVESALLTHPAVAEAAAVSAPDPDRGAVVKALVVLREGTPGEELARALQDHVKAITAPYKFPRIIEFVDELPKTASGKLRRAALRTRS
jgi:acyl-coenzyme A synthetase/AMP-(fatty) acid ligase